MYDIIGDVHGCLPEFRQLADKLGYQWTCGQPAHPEGRKLVFVGDITDRGPNSIAMIEIVSQLVRNGSGLYVPGNHCDKLYRWMSGRPVQVSHGLETTVRELKHLSEGKYKHIVRAFMTLYEESPLYHLLDDGRLVVCHAGIRTRDIGKPINKRIKSFILYGDTTGKTDEHGLPERRDWAKDYHGDALIVYGHTPVRKPRWENRSLNLDTGCVLGGNLSALRYPEEEVVSVPSSMPYDADHFRSFPQ
ncbi:bis(5'-nucleosyl)-tetraphosphatase PrpE [Sporolactobacillus sp. THM7-4]|nr:bis(5'-nucleosyl)-tetraphosphatase PrpE [Sporolactobacillus sp. THM7-4]